MKGGRGSGMKGGRGSGMKAGRGSGGKRLRWLAALLVLAGCATPPPAPAPPLSYPPSAADRVVRIATAEWRDWGEVARDAWTDGAEAPAREADPANFPRVMAYWQAVPEDHGAIPLNRRRYAATLARQPEGAALWSTPYWSAAFIAWVFRAAGVDAAEFPPSATHAFYLDGLMETARRFPAEAPFIPHAPEDRAPAPGDLLCFDRGPAPLRHWTERLAEAGRARAMHCDIVVATPPGQVQAVGGNVLDAVTMTRYPAGPDGRLLPAPPGRRPLLLLVESRLGRLPPWVRD